MATIEEIRNALDEKLTTVNNQQNHDYYGI